jgi:hypothetical protein
MGASWPLQPKSATAKLTNAPNAVLDHGIKRYHHNRDDLSEAVAK